MRQPLPRVPPPEPRTWKGPRRGRAGLGQPPSRAPGSTPTTAPGPSPPGIRKEIRKA